MATSRITPQSVSRLAPILLYGLDIPFAAFNATQHGGFKIGYLSDRDGTSFKFFDQPVYVACHGVVRGDLPSYGKYTFSVLPEEAAFVRQVEQTIMSTMDRLVSLAEPSSSITTVPLKSMTYENLIKVKLNKTVGLRQDGTVVPFDEHGSMLMNKTAVTMTLEINGMYHSDKGKGVIARIHSYKLD